MDYSINEGTTIIGYTGQSKKIDGWRIVQKTSEQAGKGATYISDLPAGKLIGKSRKQLEKEMKNVVGEKNE